MTVVYGPPPSLEPSLPPASSYLPPSLPSSRLLLLPPSLPPPLHLHFKLHLCKNYTPSQIAHYENEKISASQRGFEPRVNDIKRSIDQYTSARAECEDKIADSSEKIKVVREELVTLDEKLHALRPALKLDTLENRCMGKWRNGN